MTGPGLVIFDNDGVLVDSERLANGILAELLTEAGLPYTLDEAVRAATVILRDSQDSRQQAAAHRALGWAAMSRGEWQAAHNEFLAVL